jgi:competence protein ComEC
MRPSGFCRALPTADAVPAGAPPALARPMVPLAVAFGLGIALQVRLDFWPFAWTIAAAASLLAGGVASWLGRARPAFFLLLLGFACLGAQAMAAADRGLPAHHVGRLPDAVLTTPVPLEGWVVLPPDPRPPEVRDAEDPERTRFVAEVTRVRLAGTWYPTTGGARLTVLGPPPTLAYGDLVRGTFRLRHPRRFDNPGGFDYPAYLATQGVFLEGWARDPIEAVAAPYGSRILAAIFRLRATLLQRLDAAMPAGQAGLLKATVLGDRSGLTPEMNQAFLDSGTYHILAISGLNVSLLAGVFFGLLRILRLSPRFAAAAAAILVTGYAALAGAGASVVRAAVMADVYLLAVVLDRRADLRNSLALSALALLWWNPRYLSDVGFQLTFLATLGIVLVLPIYEPALAGCPRAIRWLPLSLVMTLAATAMTLPILAGNFYRVSPVGLLANIPIVPLSGLITGMGTAACAAFLFAPAGLAWLNQANGWLVDLLLATAAWFAAWPGSSLRAYSPSGGMLLAYYGAVACGLFWLNAGDGQARRRRVGRLARFGAGGCVLALLLQIVLKLHPLGPQPDLRLTVLDVGQGEAIYLEVPGRGRLLLDAGSIAGRDFDIGARVVAPFLWHEWVGSLDVIVLSHEQLDHTSGIPSLLRAFPVGEVWTGEAPPVTPMGLWVQEYLRHRRIPHRVVAADSPVLRWGPAALRVLHPDAEPAAKPDGTGTRALSPNDLSLVLEVRTGPHAVLLAGDLGREGEVRLLRRGVPATAQILKVPHHGSRQSSGPALLDAVRPEVAILSVGYRNAFHHPHPETLARYRERGIRLFRTDQHGAVTAEIVSEEWRVRGRRDEGSSAFDTPVPAPGGPAEDARLEPEADD